MKNRKFSVVILMTIINTAYIIGSIIKPEIMKLMPLVMTMDGIYGAYLGVNVLQKKFTPK